CYYNYFSLDVW
nr:immunoglobulin heavy chain junction region [Macaca mulatta]